MLLNYVLKYSRLKTSVLESFLMNSNITILCLAERWLGPRDHTPCKGPPEINFAFPSGYYCATKYCRNNQNRGGIGICFMNKYKSETYLL